MSTDERTVGAVDGGHRRQVVELDRRKLLDLIRMACERLAVVIPDAPSWTPTWPRSGGHAV